MVPSETVAIAGDEPDWVGYGATKKATEVSLGGSELAVCRMTRYEKGASSLGSRAASRPKSPAFPET